MSVLREFLIYSGRICSPLENEPRRRTATRFYSQTARSLATLPNKNAPAVMAQIADDMDRFMIIASDRSETQPHRILTMGMAIGDTLSNLGISIAERRRLNFSPLTTSPAVRDDFSRATCALRLEGGRRLPFRLLLEATMEIAQDKGEDVVIRRGAIELFNKVAQIASATFHQDIDRSGYEDRMCDIALTSEDRRLRLCAVKIGAGGHRRLQSPAFPPSRAF